MIHPFSDDQRIRFFFQNTFPRQNSHLPSAEGVVISPQNGHGTFLTTPPDG